MVKLREYQSDLIKKIKREFCRGKKSVVAVLGCGGGKSVIQGNIARSATEKHNNVLFLIHRKELADQIHNTFEQCDVDFRYCDIQMVQTAVRRINKLTQPDLIITDEAHHAAANSYTKIYDAFPDALRIGFTATPARLSGGLDGVFDSMVEGVSTEWLIENHYLSPYKYYSVKLVDTSKLHRRAGEYVRAEVEELMLDRAIYGDVLDSWRRYASRKKTIIYCASITSSEAVVEEFAVAGISAAHLDGTTPKGERERIIQAFRDGEITVLSNVELFGEGFDVPDCECVVLLRPTLSLTVHIQQSMRSMRYKEGKTAIIIDHVGNVFRHGFPDDIREWSLEDDREHREQGERTSFVRQCGHCFATFPSTRSICPYCGEVLTQGREEIEHREAEIAEVRRNTLRMADYTDYHKCESFEELKEFGKAHGYKFAWALRKAVEMGFYYPPKYRYMVRKLGYGQRA